MPSFRRIARKLWPVEVEQTQIQILRIFTFRGSKKFFFKGLKNHKNGQKQLFSKIQKNATAHTRGGPTCQVSDV